MTDEREVRTRAGWIGVEISKSRARSPRNPEYGLYRVRGSMPVLWSIKQGDAEIDRSPGQGEPTLWTAYAFELDVIAAQVTNAIELGTPDGPAELHLPKRRIERGELPYVTVPTRWTSTYRGRRDLGSVRRAELIWGVKTEAAAALSVRVWESMTTHEQQWHGMAQMLDRNYLRNKLAFSTPRQRQRAYNAAFQREHLKRRKWGLRQRHARKLEHNEAARSQEQAERPSQRGQDGPAGAGR